MSTVELFINPVGTDERYELNGRSASSAFMRLWKLSSVIEFQGELKFGLALLKNVPSDIVLVIIDDLGGACVGKINAPARGDPIDQYELYRRVQRHTLHNIDYFDI